MYKKSGAAGSSMNNKTFKNENCLKNDGMEVIHEKMV